MGLIIIDNTRNKRLKKILFDVTHSANEMLNFMLVDVLIIEILECGRKIMYSIMY